MGAYAQHTLVTDTMISFKCYRRKEGACYFASRSTKWAFSHMHTRMDPNKLAAADNWQNSVYRPGSRLYLLTHLSAKPGLKCSRLLLYFFR